MIGGHHRHSSGNLCRAARSDLQSLPASPFIYALLRNIWKAKPRSLIPSTYETVPPPYLRVVVAESALSQPLTNCPSLIRIPLTPFKILSRRPCLPTYPIFSYLCFPDKVKNTPLFRDPVRHDDLSRQISVVLSLPTRPSRPPKTLTSPSSVSGSAVLCPHRF